MQRWWRIRYFKERQWGGGEATWPVDRALINVRRYCDHIASRSSERPSRRPPFTLSLRTGHSDLIDLSDWTFQNTQTRSRLLNKVSKVYMCAPSGSWERPALFTPPTRRSALRGLCECLRSWALYALFSTRNWSGLSGPLLQVERSERCFEALVFNGLRCPDCANELTGRLGGPRRSTWQPPTDTQESWAHCSHTERAGLHIARCRTARHSLHPHIIIRWQ